MEGSLGGNVRAVGQQGLEPEGEEDQDVKDKPFKHPLGALVKNCNMLHNIVGPACVFLKQGFSQTLVCNTVDKVHTRCPHMPPVQLFPNMFDSFSPHIVADLCALHYTSCVIPLHHSVVRRSKSPGTTRAQRGRLFSSMENY